MRTTALLALLGIAAPAQAQISLNMPTVGQQQPNWCFAASTQMVAGYLGSTLVQCEEANHNLGRTDCCQSPSSCNVGGHTSAELDYWGFPHTTIDAALNYADLRAQIDANQ